MVYGLSALSIIAIGLLGEPLNVLNSGVHVLEVIGGHKLGVAAGEQDPSRDVTEEIFQQSSYRVNGGLF